MTEKVTVSLLIGTQLTYSENNIHACNNKQVVVVFVIVMHIICICIYIFYIVGFELMFITL